MKNVAGFSGHESVYKAPFLTSGLVDEQEFVARFSPAVSGTFPVDDVGDLVAAMGSEYKRQGKFRLFAEAVEKLFPGVCHIRYSPAVQ
jgi:hypothetical protein